jgi:hypothetical protein
MIDGLRRPLAVIAHDAGAANHIFAWLGDEQPALHLAGPAHALWRARHGETPQAALAPTVAGAAMVITGTGWASNLEHDARRLAREQGIRSVAVIDHWTNYPARFVRDGEQVLPDEIWVSDPYASQIAQAAFPSVPVVEQPNAYLAGLVAEVRAQQAPDAANDNDRVLYVLEPIRQAWGDLPEPGEFAALDYFMQQRARAQVAPGAEIRLRPHPSDPPGKYDAWLAKQGSPRIGLDTAPSLAAGLAWANVVAGCQTYAMVVALACGRTVISTIPAWAPPCVLPQLDIIRLSRLCEAST